MSQDTPKNNVVLIVVAIIGVIGTIVATIIGAMANYNIEQFRQEAELTRIALVSIATQGGATQVSTSAPIDTPYTNYTPTTPPIIPTIQAPQNVQDPDSIHGEPVSPETLAKIVGGDAAYWKQAGPYVWVYSNKGHNTLMRHPGDNMLLTYWANFGDPQSSDDCQIVISPTNSLERFVKCPSGTNAQIEADQVGLHLIDYTGYFP